MRRTPVRSRPRPQSKRPAEPGLSRLQKILAAAGLGSRRQCETLILEGRVEVDRQVVSKLGAKADPFRQEVRVDGNVLPQAKKVYYLVNKPPGVLSTNRDPAGRPRVVDLLAPRGQRLFAVGRLDMSSEGLMLVTNDGELANLLTHPRYGVHKTYHVEVAGAIEREDLARVEEGMYLAEGFARVVGARIKTRLKKSTLLEITLDEGRNREIRRLLARTGHKVLRLRRVAIGPFAWARCRWELRDRFRPMKSRRFGTGRRPKRERSAKNRKRPEPPRPAAAVPRPKRPQPRPARTRNRPPARRIGPASAPSAVPVVALNPPARRTNSSRWKSACRANRWPAATGRSDGWSSAATRLPIFRASDSKKPPASKRRTLHGGGARQTAAVVTKARGKGKAGRGTKAAPRRSVPVGANAAEPVAGSRAHDASARRSLLR